MAAFSCTRLVSWNRFCLHLGMCVCVSVCLPPRALITSGMIRCDIGPVWLVKPDLQFFSLLLSILGVTLVTQHVVHARKRCGSWHHAIHKKRHINYLAVAIRWSISFIKVSGWMRSNKSKRRLGFNFTVII